MKGLFQSQLPNSNWNNRPLHKVTCWSTWDCHY